jgi:archaellum biogenesis protein FlaJ (TadC family)
MLQELRDYWLPLMLFVGTLLVAAVLLVLVAAMPWLPEEYLVSKPLLKLFAEDTVVRRSAIAGAVGLIVTAWVFFRPKARTEEVSA